MHYYAGIGSRETPDSILGAFEKIGEKLAQTGNWTLRSGRALGADSAFERGADKVAGSSKEIFIPWPGFPSDSLLSGHPAFNFDSLDRGQRQKALDSINTYHPAPERLKPGAKKLMARNYCQMFGPREDSPATDVVVCYTSDGRASGGTGQAMRMAADHGIRVINAHGYESDPDGFVDFVMSELQKFDEPAKVPESDEEVRETVEVPAVSEDGLSLR